MKAYTCQFGQGTGDSMPAPSHSETIYADSLGEAVDKAKTMARQRPLHANESTVRIIENAADEYPLWASSVENARGTISTMADPG